MQASTAVQPRLGLRHAHGPGLKKLITDYLLTSDDLRLNIVLSMAQNVSLCMYAQVYGKFGVGRQSYT